MTATRAHRESALRVSSCITALLQEQPFFGSLALRLPIRADATRETLASDGSEIRYSPEWVANTRADFIKTAIARVVLACALKHHTRRGDRTPGKWQHASQLVTHHYLQDAGFRLPPDAEAWPELSVEGRLRPHPRSPRERPRPAAFPFRRNASIARQRNRRYLRHRRWQDLAGTRPPAIRHGFTALHR